MLEIKIILEGWYREPDEEIVARWVAQDGLESLVVPGVVFYRKHRDIIGCNYQNQLWIKPIAPPSKVPYAGNLIPTRAQRYDGMIWIDTRQSPPKRMQWSGEDLTWKEVDSTTQERPLISIPKISPPK